MTENLFRQCRLEKPLPDAVLSTTVWLPEEFSVVGMLLRLRENRQSPLVPGWKVVWVSAEPVRHRHLELCEQGRRHRHSFIHVAEYEDDILDDEGAW